MNIIEAKSKCIAVSSSTITNNVCIKQGSSKINIESSFTTENTITHYDVNKIRKISPSSDPIPFGDHISEAFTGSYPLLQKDPDKQPRLLRDREHATSFMRFNSERGDFLESEKILDARSGDEDPFDITIIALIRLRSFPVEQQKDGYRSPKRIGTLCQISTARSDLYIEGDDTQLQVTSAKGSARYSESSTNPYRWRVFAFSYNNKNPGGMSSLNQSCVFDSQFVPPFKTQGKTLEVDSVGRISLGLYRHKGYLDADVAEISIIKNRPYDFELLQISKRMLEGKIKPTSHLVSTSVSNAVGVRLRGANSWEVSDSKTHKSLPTADPGDLPNVISWSSTTDENLGLQTPRIASWENISDRSEISLKFAFQSVIARRPQLLSFEENLFLKFPKEGEGSIFPEKSYLKDSEYTILIRGCFTPGRVFNIGERESGIDIRITECPNDYGISIKTNKGLSQQREISYENVLPKSDHSDIFIRGYYNNMMEFEIDVLVNGTLLIDPQIETEDPIENIFPILEKEIVDREDPVQVALGLKTFEIQKDGSVYIGQEKNSSYSQIAWYQKPLTNDFNEGLNEILFIRKWIENRY